MRFFICCLISALCCLSQAKEFVSPMNFHKENSEYKAVVFLSSTCPCSKSHVEHLNTLEKQYENLKFYGVITDEISKDNTDSIKKYYSQKRFGFPLIEDPKQELVKKYNALKTPHVVLLKKQKDGKFKKVCEGGVTDKRDFARSGKKFLEENLAAINAGKDMPHEEGRCLGCYIRRL